MEKGSDFQKYLLCEQRFGVSAKKDIAEHIKMYLEAFRASVTKAIRERLTSMIRIERPDEVTDTIDEELKRMNIEYVVKFTDFLNRTNFK